MKAKSIIQSIRNSKLFTVNLSLLTIICSLLVFYFSLFTVSAQKHGQAKIDSLLKELPKAKEDTNKVKILDDLSWEYQQISEFNKAKEYAENALSLSGKIDYKEGKAQALNMLGNSYNYQGNYTEALNNYFAALKIFEETGTKKGISSSHSNIGLIYNIQGNYLHALKELYAALKIREEIGDKKGMANSHLNIGAIYSSQKNYPEALKEYLIALKINKEIGDKKGIAFSHNNIGSIYYFQAYYKDALKEFIAALKIRMDIGDKAGIAVSHNNIGSVYFNQRNYSLALKEYFASLKIREEIGDKKGLAFSFINIGEAKIKMQNAKEGKEWVQKGLELSKEIGFKKGIENSFDVLATADSALGNYKAAYENYKMYVVYRDSLMNEENTKKITQQQMQYEFNNVQDSIKAEQDKKDIVAQKELQKQKLVRNGFIGGFIFVLLFAIVFFRQRNKTKKEKKRSEDLLLNILPGEVAEEIKSTGHSKAKAYTMVTVMFTDFKDFTIVSEKISAELLVDEIHACFSGFDNIIQKYKIEKIKTIGDAYLCASGLPVSNYTHAADMIQAAFEIRNFMLERKKEKELKGEIPFELRIGIHTGPVVAGIVGVKKYAYDIWGDTVNIAARMEQNSEAGKINISGTTYELVKDKFTCTHRGKIEAKNKGEVDMYFVETL